MMKEVGKMVNLFDYQRVALDLIIETFKAKAIVLAVMATGLGKTIVSAFWAQGEIKKGNKGLFLCHNNGILDQAMIEYRKVLGEQVILKPFYGPDKDFDADKANVVFASFQTYVNWKEVFFEDEFDFIIVDESHHGQAPTFKEVILYFKSKKLLGITATPDRMDLKDIREIFGPEVVNYSLEEAIYGGWLTPVEYHILNDHLSHWKLKKILKKARRTRRISIKQINETIFIRRRDEEIARIIQEYAGTDKKTIIFCERIEHADNFQQFLPNALTYHIRVPGGEKENRARLNAFREGSLQYILAVNKFNEGIDVPDAEVIVFLRCTDSKTIFYQQLGRGLRKIFGKEKVVVLDFVANCERLAMVRELADRVKELLEKSFDYDRRVLHVSGAAFDFLFSDDQIEILNLVKRINERRYETWQEAGRVAIRLGMRTRDDYVRGFKIDPRLPSNPNAYYHDFPDWYVFLGRKSKEKFYSTWQEASTVAIRHKISSGLEYAKQRERIDPKLPSAPDVAYKDFPGWKVFLERHYLTWEEASRVVRQAGVGSKEDYYRLRKSDSERSKKPKKNYLESKLPRDPAKYYPDFPGWEVFLGGYRFYPTWQGASAAAIKLGFKTNKDYKSGYKKDRRLPAVPSETYKNFPGWVKFLDKSKKIEMNFYPTWKEASRSAISLGIKFQREYWKKRKLDVKLPGSPKGYYKDFPGWKIFLGGKTKKFYPTWQKASEKVKGLGIFGATEYKRKYKQDSKLPSNPNTFYKDFPSWTLFFGKREKDFYKTWQEAGAAAKLIGISNSLEYSQRYKRDPKLPSAPSYVYKDFPGWKKFLREGK